MPAEQFPAVALTLQSEPGAALPAGPALSENDRAVITMSGWPPPSRSPMRTAWGVNGHGPTPALLFSDASPAHGAIACGEIITRPNCGEALRASWVSRSSLGMSMRLRTARVRPSIT